jgi:CRP/FNR family transcriptional regulator
MNGSALHEALRALPHFRMLPADLVARIAAGARRRTLRAGESVFAAGEPCRAFFAIEQGGVRLFRAAPDGREQVVHNLRAEASFAEAALLSLGHYPVSAVATEDPTVLIEVGAQPFLQLFREDPRLATGMVASLSMRLVDLVERVEDLAQVQAGTRLARWLVRHPATAGAAPELDLSLAKKDLAGHLAMTPETLSRLLRRWQDAGWIEVERNHLRLLRPDALLALAQGASDEA